MRERPFYISRYNLVYVLLIIGMAAQFMTSVSARTWQERWLNVPPAPQSETATLSSLGDKAFAYRINALMLQNFGDNGGMTTALKDYDFERLGRWFMVMDELDPRSNFVPYLAGYYFGGSQDGALIAPVVDYLAHVGMHPYWQSWRWLGQATYLAQYRLKDMERAQRFALLLSQKPDKDLPEWARSMPYVVMNNRGEKATAATMLLSRMQDVRSMTLTEFNLLKDILCNRTLDREEAEGLELCEGALEPAKDAEE